MVKSIMNGEQTLAIVIPAGYSKPGITFFTPSTYSQQLAFMNHVKGHNIQAHIHNQLDRHVEYTQEVLVLRKGKLKVNFYDNDHSYLESCVLSAGDIILLASGGHGFEVLEDVEMIEVKQGPYAGDKDKTRFDGIEFVE